ncbi:MAG: hypothetical protein HQ557_02770 [Bacteroidetes bacterium]|nr:hypothetical protein [Bacteroidota bacterium]
MFENIYAYIIDKAAYLQETYGINPWIFLIMSVILAFPFYYSIYRLIRSITSRNKKQFVFWGTSFLILTIIPYLYIFIWGHNLPWYIYVIIVFLILNGLYSLIRKLRKKQSAGDDKDDSDNPGHN